MILISTLSSIPGQDLPDVKVPYLDKLIHLTEYLALGFLLIRAFLNSNLNISLAKAVILSIIITSFYAVIDEWHQRFISGRSPDYFDFLADFIGASIGIFLYKKRG